MLFSNCFQDTIANSKKLYGNCFCQHQSFIMRLIFRRFGITLIGKTGDGLAFPTSSPRPRYFYQWIVILSHHSKGGFYR
jgi:hypothetical protein